jgi:hypothetical protein
LRTEDIVECAFFAVLLAGIVLIILGSAKKRGSPEAVRRIGAGLLVEGLAFLSFGLVTAYLIRGSDRLLVEGEIWAVRQGHGKYRGSNFEVTDAAGRPVRIRCRYDGVGLRQGDRARIRFIRYNGQLLQMTLLSGPYTGWELEESSGERAGWVIAALGIVCLIGRLGSGGRWGGSLRTLEMQSHRLRAPHLPRNDAGTCFGADLAWILSQPKSCPHPRALPGRRDA